MGAAAPALLDGVVARWFETCNCQTAVIRPDHYVYSVAEDCVTRRTDPQAGAAEIARMKQVLVVNSSLALPPGKLAAQVAHASIAAFLSADNAQRRKWLEVGMPKIVLDGGTEALLTRLLQQALDTGLPAQLVRDAGKTLIPEGTVTCLGIGPASAEQIDAVTGALALLK